jgi:hypothetical protein
MAAAIAAAEYEAVSSAAATAASSLAPQVTTSPTKSLASPAPAPVSASAVASLSQVPDSNDAKPLELHERTSSSEIERVTAKLGGLSHTRSRDASAKKAVRDRRSREAATVTPTSMTTTATATTTATDMTTTTPSTTTGDAPTNLTPATGTNVDSVKTVAVAKAAAAQADAVMSVRMPSRRASVLASRLSAVGADGNVCFKLNIGARNLIRLNNQFGLPRPPNEKDKKMITSDCVVAVHLSTPGAGTGTGDQFVLIAQTGLEPNDGRPVFAETIELTHKLYNDGFDGDASSPKELNDALLIFSVFDTVEGRLPARLICC